MTGNEGKALQVDSGGVWVDLGWIRVMIGVDLGGFAWIWEVTGNDGKGLR